MIEIDGVRSRLHDFVTEAGDYISDEYFNLIDAATSPESISDINTARLARIIRRLNSNIATTSVYLSDTEAAAAYDSVVEQINHLNEGRDVPELTSLIANATAALPDFGSRFHWGL